MKVAQRLENINEYYFSQKLSAIGEMNKSGRQVINLGIGSPDLPPRPAVINRLCEESQKPGVHGYQGYKGVPALRNAISKWYLDWYGVKLEAETEILPLAGSKEGIMHICMTYLNPGDQALIPDPGYPTYRSAVELAGGECISYSLKEENNWFPQLDELEKMNLNKVKLMWVNYPHMPTGQLPTQELFEQIIGFGKKHDILICHDNPYSFILNDNPKSILNVEGAMQTAVELNSCSKSHNMAGWRIGMLCGAAENIKNVLRFKSNMDSGMFLSLQLAAAEALQSGKEWHDELNKVYSSRRGKVHDLLRRIGCTYSENQAGLFVWAAIPKEFPDSYALSDRILNDYRVFLTPGGIFGSEGESFIRVSLCSPEGTIEEAISRISSK